MLKTFSAAPLRPNLVGGLGGNERVAAFVAEFGDRWLRTPVKGVWACGSQTRPISFTRAKDGSSFAMYPHSIEEFKTLFGADGYVGSGEVVYMDVDDRFKWDYLQLLDMIE